MQVIYQLTEQDFRDAIKGYGRLRIISWVVLVILIVTVITGLLFSFIEPERRIFQDLVPFCIIVAFWFGLLRLIPHWSARKQFKGMPSVKFPITADVSEGGIEFHTKIGNSTTSWAAFPKWREERTVFVLYTSPYVFHILPKRAFAAGESKEFTEILERNIPSK